MWIEDALYDALVEGAKSEHRSLAKQAVHILAAALPASLTQDSPEQLDKSDNGNGRSEAGSGAVPPPTGA